MRRDLAILCLRNAIADKEHAIANANMETAQNGAWSRNWNESIWKADKEAQDMVRAIAKAEDAEREAGT